MSNPCGARWFAAGGALGFVQLGALWVLGVWDLSPFFYGGFFCLGPSAAEAISWAEGWLILALCQLVTLEATVLVALHADRRSGYRPMRDFVARRRLAVFTAFAHGSAVVLGEGLLLIFCLGSSELVPLCERVLSGAGLPVLSPVLQLTGSVVFGVGLACYAWWTVCPPTYLRVQDRVMSTLAGIGWVLVPVFLIDPPWFAQ